jgi:predicted amidohydrolase YtcJ
MTIPAAEYIEAMRTGIKLANSRGVTCVNDKDGWLGAVGLWQRLEEQGALSLRVWQSVPADKLPELRGLSLRSGFGSPLLRVGYLKVFMDGTLGSQTAWMLDGTGVRITSGGDLAEIVRAGAAAGWPVGVHAIGDRANREALDAFERTRNVWQPAGLRQRIEHAQCLSPEDIPRFGELGVAVSAQFTHAPSDRHLAERFWGDKLEGTYAFRSLVDSGALVANGSDAPIEELDPWAGVVAGVLRTSDARPAWRPEEALTLDQALHATCVAPTWLSHDERSRGTLVPGRLADLVVLDRDPFALPVEALPEVQVVATMVAGRWVHNPPPWG